MPIPISINIIQAPMRPLISPFVLAVVVLILALHCPLLRVTVNSYSVLGLRPVIVHGLFVHSAQPGDGGVQVISFSLFGGSHCRVTLLDSAVAVTIVGSRSIQILSNNIQDITNSQVN